jgi:hypothetical protein
VSNENLTTWTGSLRGDAMGIDPAIYYVAIFVKKERLWNTLLHESSARITISNDNHWICTSASLEADQVSEVIIFLIPNRFNTPIIDGEMSLPMELHLVAVATQRIRYSTED